MAPRAEICWGINPDNNMIDSFYHKPELTPNQLSYLAGPNLHIYPPETADI